MEDRRLTAIMFTDIVGYTALMGKDERKAHEMIRMNRKIHFSLIKQYKGTFLKEMGDGILAFKGQNERTIQLLSEINDNKGFLIAGTSRNLKMNHFLNQYVRMKGM